MERHVSAALSSAQDGLYQGDAFRVLGLPVDASSRDIRRRAEELRLRLELDGSDPDGLEEVRSAATLLEDPVRRLFEELYWVHLTPNPIPLQFDPSDLAAVRAAMQALKPLVQSGNDEALHDLTVLTHIAAIAGDGADLPFWKEALSRWHQVWASDVFWLRMQMRAEGMADPRVTDETVAALRADLPNQVLKPSAVLAGRRLDDGQEKQGAEHLNLIQQSEFPPEAVAKACCDATSGIRTRLKAAIEELRAEMAGQDEGKASSVLGSIFGSVWDKAQKRVVPLVKTLKEVYPEGTEVQVLADEAAEFLTALSIRLHNEAEDSEMALTVAISARRVASSESTKQRARQGIQTLRYQVAFKRAIAYAKANRWMEAAASAKEAKEQTADPEEQRQLDLFITRCILEAKASGQSTILPLVTSSRLGKKVAGPPSGPHTRSQPSQPTPSGHGRSNPLATGLKIVGVLVFGLWLLSHFVSTSSVKSNPSVTTGNNSSSRAPMTAPSSSSSSRGMSSVGSTSSVQDLPNRLDGLKKEIDSQRSTIELAQSRLQLAENDLDSMQSQLNSTESQYQYTGAPSYVVSEYESLRSRYNQAVSNYNFDLSRVKTMTADFNDKVDEYNRLLSQLKGTK